MESTEKESEARELAQVYRIYMAQYRRVCCYILYQDIYMPPCIMEEGVEWSLPVTTFAERK